MLWSQFINLSKLTSHFSGIFECINICKVEKGEATYDMNNSDNNAKDKLLTIAWMKGLDNNSISSCIELLIFGINDLLHIKYNESNKLSQY